MGSIEDTAFWCSVPDIANDITEARSESAVPLDQYRAGRATRLK